MKDSFQKGFSRYERNGIIFLCALILISIVSQRLVLHFFKTEHALTAADKLKIENLQLQISAAKITPPWQEHSYSSGSAYRQEYPTKADYNRSKYDFKIEVNSATKEDYEKLYGIGKVLSERIVKFRDKLGGFYSVGQLKDVYGIQDSAFQKFKKNLTIKPVKIKKLNINTATYEELTLNPYFFSTLAKQVIGYRTKIKPFETPEEVRNLYYIRDHPETYDKIAVYISVN